MEQVAMDCPQRRRRRTSVRVKPRHLMLGLLGLAAAGTCLLLGS